MKKNTFYIKALLFIFLLTTALKSYCQDTIRAFNYDTTIARLTYFTSIRFQMPFEFLGRRPNDADESNVKMYGYLRNELPDADNYDKYYSLACSLWDLNRPEQAEKMFLNIINSKKKYYSDTYNHSSDVPKGTTAGIYGYGSFSSNYKHSAAIYLTKIYIEKGEFEKALPFLEDAIKKYKVSYSCGTGHRSQQDEYNFLYGRIYEGQKNYEKVKELLLPECLTRDDQIIVRVIKKQYSHQQIQEKVQQAENSIQCEFDTEPSFSYSYHGSILDKANVDTIAYYSGKAKINLFDKDVEIPKPHLENGERVTKELFLREFRESSFYQNLIGDK